MGPACRHGNPLSNYCSFCKREDQGRKEGPAQGFIPGAHEKLSTLACPNCDYTTSYADALSRHVCDKGVSPGVEEVARELLEDLKRRPPPAVRVAKRVRSLVERLAVLWPRLDPKVKETRFERAENYLAALCNELGIKKPLLLFSDEMQNEGACGEAGRVSIRLHTPSMLNGDWSDVMRTIRHEVAHIVVHNTPGMGEAPAHGVEFETALIRVSGVANRMSEKGFPQR